MMSIDAPAAGMYTDTIANHLAHEVIDQRS